MWGLLLVLVDAHGTGMLGHEADELVLVLGALELALEPIGLQGSEATTEGDDVLGAPAAADASNVSHLRETIAVDLAMPVDRIHVHPHQDRAVGELPPHFSETDALEQHVQLCRFPTCPAVVVEQMFACPESGTGWCGKQRGLVKHDVLLLCA